MCYSANVLNMMFEIKKNLTYEILASFKLAHQPIS